MQPVLILTDHKALESWAREVLDTPSGPVGRRSRWHEFFSRFNLEVGYVPGKDNLIADVMSRWAYPASEAFRDLCKHGSAQDKTEMDEILRQELEDEKMCMRICEADHRLVPDKGRVPKIELPQDIGADHRLGSMQIGLGCGSLGTESPSAFVGDPKGINWVSPEGNEELGDDGVDEQIPEPQHNDGSGSSSSDPNFLRNTPGIGESLASSSQPPDGSHMRPVEPPEGGDDDELMSPDTFGREYKKCPRWSEIFAASLDTERPWPEKFRVEHGYLFTEERLCVPLPLQGRVISTCHAHWGHVGYERFWQNANLHFEWASSELAKKEARKAMKECTVCQAFRNPSNLRGRVEFAPVPKRIMYSVALDIFKMPLTKCEGIVYDQILLCVDRHSGWIVAEPCFSKGFTGAKAAQLMIKNWRFFGMPSKITSDQGSHFISAWWRTMCSKLGITLSFSQAYNHRSNGRAERAGQQVIERLRKLCLGGKHNWVEMLPVALDKLHDVPSEAGISPFYALFGRERPLGRLPYEIPHEAVDASEFFVRMKEIDELISNRLNETHGKEANRLNQGVPVRHQLSIGQKVWYRRPENTGNKLDSPWIGPAQVVARTGQESYDIVVKEGHVMSAPLRYLAPYVEDTLGKTSIPLFTYTRTPTPEEMATPDSWETEAIVGHTIDKKGRLMYKVKWKGWEDVTLEPASSFVPSYNQDWYDYNSRNGLWGAPGSFP